MGVCMFVRICMSKWEIMTSQVYGKSFKFDDKDEVYWLTSVWTHSIHNTLFKWNLKMVNRFDRPRNIMKKKAIAFMHLGGVSFQQLHQRSNTHTRAHETARKTFSSNCETTHAQWIFANFQGYFIVMPTYY